MWMTVKRWAMKGLFLVLVGMSSSAKAAESVNLYVYYPGGDASTEEAQTLMGLLGDAVTQSSAVPVVAQYHPDRKTGELLLAKKSNTLILMRLDSYLEFLQKGAELYPQLITEPALGSGATMYRIYGSKAAATAAGALPCDKLYLGVDLSSDYLGHLFAPEWQRVPRIPTDEPLQKLEEIARSTSGTKDCMVLDARQWEALETVKFPWQELLQLVKESVPTLNAMVVSVGKPASDAEKVVKALDQLDDKGDHQELLMELQLKRFVPLNADQVALLDTWKKRYVQK